MVANFPAFERGEIDDAVRTELAVEAITLVFVSLLGLALAGRVLRPLRRLAATAKGISDTDLTQRIPVSGRDEASQIAGAFNDMLARLERTFETQRRFLDDTSHELRSPLTVIRGHVELLELSADPVERRETIELVTDEIDRISNLVDDLSLLARAEQPGFLDVQPVDLRDLVLAVHRKATALGDRDWLAEPQRSAVIAADRHRVTQALLQLAENAVKYTGTGMVIRIGADVVGDEAVFWVDDTGAGVSSDDADRIFQRFSRGHTDHGARPREGRGLGLAIVAAIARSHHGNVRLVRRSGRGARFEITLPVVRVDAVPIPDRASPRGR